MRFSNLALIFASGALAFPSTGGSKDNGIAVVSRSSNQVRFPVPDNLTIKQAQAKCGDQAQLSCCNHATYAGDTTDVNKGLLAGTLSHIAGTGSGASGLGLFDQCSQLDVQIPAVVGLLGVQDLVKKQCQQNIACCQNSPSSAVKWGFDWLGFALRSSRSFALVK